MAIQKSTFILSLIIAVLVSMGAGIATYHFLLKDMWNPKPTTSVTMQNATTASSPTTNSINAENIAKQPTTVEDLFPGIKNAENTKDFDITSYSIGNTKNYQDLITFLVTPGMQIASEKEYCDANGYPCEYNKKALEAELKDARNRLDKILSNPTINFSDDSTAFSLEIFYNRVPSGGGLISPIQKVELSKPLTNMIAFVSTEGQDVNFDYTLRLLGKVGSEYFTAFMYLEPLCIKEKDAVTSEGCIIQKKIDSCYANWDKECSPVETSKTAVVQEKIAKAVKKMESVLYGK